MIWSSGGIDGKECCGLSTGGDVGTSNGDREANDVINVDIVGSLGVDGMLTINPAPAAKGISGSRSSLLGTRCWFGAKSSLGSQSLQGRIAFTIKNCLQDDSPLEKDRAFHQSSAEAS